MNKQNLATLQVFESFFHKCKSHLLQVGQKSIRFLCKCIKNLIKRNLQSMKRHHVATFQNEVQLLSLKLTTWKLKRHSDVRRRVIAHKSYYPCCHEPFVSTWSSLSSLMLLGATRVWIPCQLQSRNFQSINFYKIPSAQLSKWFT